MDGFSTGLTAVPAPERANPECAAVLALCAITASGFFA
ncbi:hypothetical protein HMPREF1494_1466 [Bifidobacterium sp. MSTE12]|nr:hypothetical protein HMPREF1494_1466 [Bifidobacterium sp. MSTE12]